MSFQLDSDDKSLAGASLIERTVREIQRAFSKEKKQHGLTQQALAQKLGLKHRSVVNRWLLGKENLSLKTIGELAWALNKRATIKFEDIDDGNFFEAAPPQQAAGKPSSIIGASSKSIGNWTSTKSKVTKAETAVLENAQ
ncbi:helix-turn-helix transcriptional regulator [Methylobacterium sp. Gmos1]